jgi:hypothetical protein
MKKFFSIVAAAVIALSFASCNPNEGGVQSKSLKITVSEVAFSTAYIKAVPADEKAYYYFSYAPTEFIKNYTVDTIVANLNAKYAAYLNQGYGLDVFVQGGLLFQGETSGQLTKLTPATNYAVFGCVLEVEEGEDGKKFVAPDGWSIVYFKTTEKKEGDVDPIQYDTNSDFNQDFDTYSVNGQYVAQYGVAIVSAKSATASAALYVNLEKTAQSLPTGVYPINDTEDPMTVTASEGLDDEGYLTPSYICTLNAKGQAEKAWFIISGNVTINADGSIVIDGKNSYGKSVKSTLKAPAAAGAPAYEKTILNATQKFEEFTTNTNIAL